MYPFPDRIVCGLSKKTRCLVIFRVLTDSEIEYHIHIFRNEFLLFTLNRLMKTYGHDRVTKLIKVPSKLRKNDIVNLISDAVKWVEYPKSYPNRFMIKAAITESARQSGVSVVVNLDEEHLLMERIMLYNIMNT